MRGRLVLALISSVLAVGLAELTVRIMVRHEPNIRFAEMAVAAERKGVGDTLARLVVEDEQRFWRLGRDLRPGNADGPLGEVVSNSAGLRDHREIPYEKPPGELRVLFLGDSSTFGWDLPHDQTTAFFTERLLQERLPGVGVRCLNAGVPGYTVYQGWRTLETEGVRYAPDLIVASFGFNDSSGWAGRGDLEMAAWFEATQPPAGLRWSALAQLARRGLQPPPAGAPGGERPRLTPEEFTEVFGRIAALADREGMGLLLLVGGLRINVDGSKPASYRRPLQYAQYLFGERHPFGIPPRPGFVDAVPIVQRLAARHGVDAVFLDRVHPTPLTNRAVAEALAERASPWLQTRIRYAPGP